MPAPVEFTITMSALTAGFNGDPQELADEIVARLTITPSEPWSSFINGGAEPLSDVGPWLKLGQEWKVWDVGLGAYTYHVQNGAGIVDGTITAVKLAAGAIDAAALGSGSVTLVKMANGTAKGVLTYNASGVPTVSAAGTDGWVLTQSAAGPVMAALPAVTSFAAYPAQSELTSGPQSITLGAVAVKCTLNLATYNPAPAPFNTTTYRYVAQADGGYLAGALAIFSNNTGTAAGMKITLRLYVNGADTGVFAFNGTPSPNLSDWTVAIPPILLDLNATDYVEFFVEAADGVDTGLLNLTNIDASFVRVSSI